jgi:hypothetical protein
MKSCKTNDGPLAPSGAINRLNRLACCIAAASLAPFAITVCAQQGGDSQPPSVKMQTAPRPELQQAYRPAPRDPFKRDVKPKEQVKKALAKQQGPRLLGYPALEVRRAEFRRAVDMAISSDRPEPDPLTQYLVSEVEVVGVFRDERGPGAFVRATPTGTTFFARGGARVYNGEVLRIETDASGAGPSQVMFREVSYVESNGKQSPQEKVVTKVPTAASVKK